MFTTKNPTHCLKCQSKDIFLGDVTYKKDANGEETNTAVLGVWFCNHCGEVLGRKMSQYENDLDPKSL